MSEYTVCDPPLHFTAQRQTADKSPATSSPESMFARTNGYKEHSQSNFAVESFNIQTWCGCVSSFPFCCQPALLFRVSSVRVVVLCSGPGPLWDDGERLAEESSDDAGPHSRVLCSLQDTGRVSVHTVLHRESHNTL